MALILIILFYPFLKNFQQTDFYSFNLFFRYKKSVDMRPYLRLKIKMALNEKFLYLSANLNILSF